MRVVLGALGVVDESGEDNDSEDEEEDEEAEFVSAGFERLYENLESRRVPSQLEQSHDTDHTEHAHGHAHIQSMFLIERWNRNFIMAVNVGARPPS